MTQRRSGSREAAESLAVQALSFIAADPEELRRFLTTTGIEPEQIRMAAREPLFLAGVLDHIAGYEPLLMSFAAQIGIEPGEIAKARAALGGGSERDIP